MIATRFVEVITAPPGERGARLALHVTGRGPLAVLLHGFPLDHRMWLDVMHGPLAERRTLCAIDLRGHGQSPWTGDAVHTMERFADDVAAVIRTFGDEPADVAGLSMGGYAAFALWSRHPELVRSLILSNTRAAADTDEQRASRDSSVQAVVRNGRTAIIDAMLPKLLAPDADAMHQARIRTMIRDLSVESIVADLRGLQRRADRRPELAKITVPTLVVAGELDGIIPIAEAECMRDGIPGARLEIVPGTAHMTPLENPTAWSAAATPLWT